MSILAATTIPPLIVMGARQQSKKLSRFSILFFYTKSCVCLPGYLTGLELCGVLARASWCLVLPLLLRHFAKTSNAICSWRCQHGQQVLQRGQAEHAFILFIFKPLSLLAATVNRGDTNWHH
jgi:hypothetical protein